MSGSAAGCCGRVAVARAASVLLLVYLCGSAQVLRGIVFLALLLSLPVTLSICVKHARVLLITLIKRCCLRDHAIISRLSSNFASFPNNAAVPTEWRHGERWAPTWRRWWWHMNRAPNEVGGEEDKQVPAVVQGP